MIEKFDVFKDENLNCYQLRTKTNSYILEFDDDEKEKIFLGIVSYIKKKKDLTLQKLKNEVQAGDNEPKVIDVLKTLDEYRLLPFELSYKLKTEDVDSKSTHWGNTVKYASDFVLTIFGKGKLTDKLKNQAVVKGFKDVHVVIYDEIDNIEKEVAKSDFFIVDANEWSPFYIELINKHALKLNKPWLYVGGVEGVFINVGPLFYGKETGCYNCLMSRLKSNHEYPEFLISYENYLRKNRLSAKPDVVPCPDLIYNIAANFSLLEITKFIELWSLPITWRNVVTLDVTNLRTVHHKLLKKPFCEVCKPELEYNSAPWLESITLK